jgi:O-acetyl-ADP-ribose deacetylase (regulator of RNase III)
MAKKRCFVISPIGDEGSGVREHADDVFRFIIEPAVQKFDIEAVRSDHIHETGEISEQMFREIIQADLCVAVLTYLNPNVFYELAVAQSAGRPVILLVEKGQKLPFDIQDFRTVKYALLPATKLIEGRYASLVKEQIRSIEEQNWTVPSLLEQYKGWPRIRTERQLRQFEEMVKPTPISEGVDKVYRLDDDSPRQLIVRTGDIRRTIKESGVTADAVVTLDDTYLQLGLYYEASVSGILRYLDAVKTAGKRVLHDHAHDALHEQLAHLNVELPVIPGAVFFTRTAGLAKYGVKYLVHVAAMQGQVGEGYHLMDDMVRECIRNVFEYFAEFAERDQLTSILFPMLGAGTTDLKLVEVAKRLLNAIVTCAHLAPTCKTVYVLTWLESHRHAIRKAAQELDLKPVKSSPSRKSK